MHTTYAEKIKVTLRSGLLRESTAVAGGESRGTESDSCSIPYMYDVMIAPTMLTDGNAEHVVQKKKENSAGRGLQKVRECDCGESVGRTRKNKNSSKHNNFRSIYCKVSP